MAPVVELRAAVECRKLRCRVAQGKGILRIMWATPAAHEEARADCVTRASWFLDGSIVAQRRGRTNSSRAIAAVASSTIVEGSGTHRCQIVPCTATLSVL